MQNFRQIIMQNKEVENIEETIARVQKMERYFDEILETMKVDQNILKESEDIYKKFQELLTYYESGLWLQDYECDERGKLPKGLKKGVLSEDGLYNLLTEVDEICNGSIEDENSHTESHYEK